MARSYSRTGAANKLSRFISQRKLLRKGDRVVIGVSGGSMPPDETVDFTLDRPFLFVITGRDGMPLFVGIVNNPVS